MIVPLNKRDSEMIPDNVGTITYEFARNVPNFRQQADSSSTWRQYPHSHPRPECHYVCSQRLICFITKGKMSK